MSNFYLKFAVLLLLVLNSCETMVSTKTIDKEVFTFKHAGKNISLPVELQEIRTSSRRGQLFSGRKISYDYALVVGYQNQELIEIPCEQDASIDDLITKLKIKRSKDRKHFAVGFGRQTIAIFHIFNQKRFVGYAPKVNPEEYHDFKELNLNKLPTPREVLLAHIAGDKPLLALDESTLVDVLCTVSPQDELNQEAIYMLTDGRSMSLGDANEERLINHCKQSDNWRRLAISELKDNREDLDAKSYISMLYKIAGKSEIEKEDWKALKNFDRDRDFEYFRLRMNMTEPMINQDVKKQFKTKLEKNVFNVCALSQAQRGNIKTSIQLLKEMGERHVFERFVESYEKSGCKSQTIHAFNNDFMFISDLKSHEKRVWVDFMVRNFKHVPPNDRDWDFDRIQDELSCKEKRDLLLKYRKDIDTFGDMEVPECN